jgi:hypothetical protein
VRYRLLILSVALAGCSSGTTETGYKYRPLGDSSAVRQAYYAQPFSPSAVAVEREREEALKRRRPDVNR